MKLNISAEEYIQINSDYWNEVLYYVIRMNNPQLEKIVRRRIELIEGFSIKSN
jgi:hypothetical protein